MTNIWNLWVSMLINALLGTTMALSSIHTVGCVQRTIIDRQPVLNPSTYEVGPIRSISRKQVLGSFRNLALSYRTIMGTNWRSRIFWEKSRSTKTGQDCEGNLYWPTRVKEKCFIRTDVSILCDVSMNIVFLSVNKQSTNQPDRTIPGNKSQKSMTSGFVFVGIAHP